MKLLLWVTANYRLMWNCLNVFSTPKLLANTACVAVSVTTSANDYSAVSAPSFTDRWSASYSRDWRAVLLYTVMCVVSAKKTKDSEACILLTGGPGGPWKPSGPPSPRTPLTPTGPERPGGPAGPRFPRPPWGPCCPLSPTYRAG